MGQKLVSNCVERGDKTRYYNKSLHGRPPVRRIEPVVGTGYDHHSQTLAMLHRVLCQIE